MALSLVLGAALLIIAPSPFSRSLTPEMAGLFVGGVGFLLNTYFLYRLNERMQLSETRREMTSSFLKGDEKTAYGLLSAAGGEMTQKELSSEAGFSAVRTHRVLHRLQSKNIISISPSGMTNKILLSDSAMDSA